MVSGRLARSMNPRSLFTFLLIELLELLGWHYVSTMESARMSSNDVSSGSFLNQYLKS